MAKKSKKREPASSAKDKPEFSRYTSYNTYAKGADKKPYVTLWVSTSDYYVRDPNPDDEWDAGDGAETLEAFGVSLGTPGAIATGRYSGRDVSLAEEHIGFMPAVGDEVFLVIEVYGEGCTFGSTRPCYRPVKCFPSRDAAVAWLGTMEAERCKDTDYFGGHEAYQIEAVIVTAGIKSK